MSLSKKELNQFNAVLLEKQQQLEELIVISAVRSEVVGLDQTKVGRVSRGDAMQQQQMAIANRHAYQQQLTQTKQALLRIQKKNYGYCEECGEVISVQRLTIKPEALFCIACQQEAEL